MPGANSRYTPPDSKTHQKLVEIAEGVYVEGDVLNIVCKIHDINPNLKVKFLDPDSPASLLDAPYRVVEMCPDQIERVVCTAWTLDEQLVERLRMADSLIIDVQAELDKQNAKARAEQERLAQEENDAVQEMVVDVLKSPKDTYKATNPVSGQEHVFTSIPKED